MKEMKVLTRQQVANHLQKYRRKMRLVVKRSEEDASIASSYSPMSTESDQSERDSSMSSLNLVKFTQNQFQGNQTIPSVQPAIDIPNEKEEANEQLARNPNTQPRNRMRSDSLIPESAFQPLQINSSPFQASTLPLQPRAGPSSSMNSIPGSFNMLDWLNPTMNHFVMSQLSQNLMHPQAIAQIQNLMYAANPYIPNILGPAMSMRTQKKDEQ